MSAFTANLDILKNHQVDLWAIDPNQLSEQAVTFLTTLLSHEETQKLLSYRHKMTQHSALITRALCRLVLAHYNNCSTSALQFMRNSQGKPALLNNNKDIRFNLSHNNQLIIMAVCVGDEIGCDIEDPQRKVNISTISKRYFAAQEHQQLSQLTGVEQQQQFFKCWTLKEAFVKATGVGIGLGLDTFYFSFPGMAACENREPLQTISKQAQQWHFDEENIGIHFNSHYPLNKDAPWQFYQTIFKQQILSICRATELPQKINYRDATSLIEQSLLAIE